VMIASAAGLLVIGWLGAGPLVLAIPTMVVVWDLARSRRLSYWWRRLRLTWGPLLATAVVAPWAIAAWVATDGDFLRVAIGHHVIDRSVTAFESHGGFAGFYLITALVVAFPWFGLLLESVRGRWRDLPPDDRFLLAWAVGWLVVVELVRTKLVHYWMPCYPAAILLVVTWLWAGGDVVGAGRRFRVATAVGGMVLAAVPVVIAAKLAVAYTPAAVTALLFLAATAVLVTNRIDLRRRALVAAAVATLALSLLVTWMLPSMAPRLLPKLLADETAIERRPGEALVVLHLRDDELLFELPLDAEVVRDDVVLADRLRAGAPTLIVARTGDAETFQEQRGLPPLEQAAVVCGIELGRLQESEAVLLRGGEG